MSRGEIWLINLDPTIGSEIKKIRPAIIVNDNSIGSLPLKVIVPITEWKEKYAIAPWMVRIEPDSGNGLGKASSADTFQIRSVAQERFVRKIGKLNDIAMEEITKALAIVLCINFR
jgi:mRNA interferase MazF